MEITIEELQLLTRPKNDGPLGPSTARSTVDPAPWELGASYLIRTVTMTLTGKLVAVYPTELVLSDAAWIADSGRWAEAAKSGKFNEVEPFAADVIVGRGALIDATVVTFDVPRSQK